MKTLKQLIKDGNFNYVNSDITEENFPAPKEIRTDFKLYHFDRYISSKDAIKEMKKDGYEPASVYELLSWEEWNKEDFVIALGSVADVGGRRCVACLDRDVSGRELRLGWFGSGWGGGCRFLAVRNGSQALETKSSCPSETLTLDQAIKICKDNGLVVYQQK